MPQSMPTRAEWRTAMESMYEKFSSVIPVELARDVVQYVDRELFPPRLDYVNCDRIDEKLKTTAADVNTVTCGSNGCYLDSEKTSANSSFGDDTICPCPTGFSQTAWNGDLYQTRTCKRDTSFTASELQCGKAICAPLDDDSPNCSIDNDLLASCPTGYDLDGYTDDLFCVKRLCKKNYT